MQKTRALLRTLLKLGNFFKSTEWTGALTRIPTGAFIILEAKLCDNALLVPNARADVWLTCMGDIPHGSSTRRSRGSKTYRHVIVALKRASGNERTL